MLFVDAVALTRFVHADKEAEGDVDAASRLTSHLIKHLLRGFNAKDKNVRFRSTQFVAVLITGLGELEWVTAYLQGDPILIGLRCSDGDYQAMREALLIRANDKEASIRVQAAVALCKLQDKDELDNREIFAERIEAMLAGEDDDDDTGRTPVEKLVDLMCCDPSAWVLTLQG